MIRDQIRALHRHGYDFLVLAGSLPDGPFPAPVIQIPALAYDRYLTRNLEPQSIADDILAAIYRQWPQGANLIHVHNPTLAKNRHLQAILKKLQANDQLLLCQIHDFAEDGRLDAYFSEPYVKDCHYIAINPRDRPVRRANVGLLASPCFS